VIRETGLEAAVTLAVPAEGVTHDGWSPDDAAAMLEAEGASVVGVNCFRGPATTLPLLRPLVERLTVPVAALPVTYRTTPDSPTFFRLSDPAAEGLLDERPFPTALEPLSVNRYEVARFTVAARELGVTYLGLCCGGAPHTVRAMAEALGRTPPASAYSPDMDKHFAFGSDPTLSPAQHATASRL